MKKILLTAEGQFGIAVAGMVAMTAWITYNCLTYGIHPGMVFEF